jgi:hypothetical protein
MDKQKPIDSLCNNLLSLFKEVQTLSEQTNIPDNDQISLQRSYDRLILWSKGHRITDGCLDNTLSDQGITRLRKVVIETLSHMGTVLIDRKFRDYILHT